MHTLTLNTLCICHQWG